MHHIYLYEYGKSFRYIKIGHITIDDHEEEVVYNFDSMRIMKILPIGSIHDINGIDSKKLSELLMDCLECNLGYIFIPESELHFYFKKHEECKQIVKDFVKPLILETWTFQEIQEYIEFIKQESPNSDIISFMESVYLAKDT